MAKTRTVETYKIHTLGDLLDHLAEIAKDHEVSSVLDATVDSEGGDTFTEFRIIERTLSDGSKALDFELKDGE